MPSRVGHISHVYEDGSARAVNELTNEEWFGRIIIGSGGMLMFDQLDERLRPAGPEIVYHPDSVTKAEAAAEEPVPGAVKVAVGKTRA
jgi:hypothetical protein